MCVVVGYVPTAEGEAALTAALAEAEQRADSVVVVLSQRERFGTDAAELQASADRLRQRLADTGLKFDVKLTTRGRDVADDIVAAAAAESARLIVIGLRRRSPMGKLLLGSNAQRILLDASCPVLAVKPEE